MKAKLEFDLPEEKEEFEQAAKAGDLHLALWDISQLIFRPARKHGYSQLSIQEMLDKADSAGGEEIHPGTELISLLEGEFYSILTKYGIEL